MMTLSRTLALTAVSAALLGLSGWTGAPAPATAPAPAVTQVSCSELTRRMSRHRRTGAGDGRGLRRR